MPDQPLVSNARQILDRVQLTRIITYEVAAKRVASAVSQPSQTSDAPMRLMLRDTDRELETRLRMTHRTDEAVLVADVGAVYSKKEPFKATPDAVHDFVEKVGAMTVIPFLRESIAMSAVRLGVKVPILDLVRQGSFHVGSTPRPSSPPREDADSASPSAEDT